MNESELKVPKRLGNHVQTWCISLSDKAALAKTYGVALSSDEKERAARFHFDEDRHRFIATRGILRHLLGSYLRQAPDELGFGQNRFGKPFLDHPPNSTDIHFNVSHSGDVAMLAFARRFHVGIDVEKSRELRDMESVAKRCLSAEQFDTFRQLPADETRVQAFYRFWTRKEALIKALGCGLSQPLGDFDVTFLDRQPPALVRAASGFDNIGDWPVYDVSAPDHYHASLAIHRTDESSNRVGLSLSEHSYP